MNKGVLTYISALIGLLCKIRLYMYIILHHTYILYKASMHKRKKRAFVSSTKSTLQLPNALYNIAQNILHIDTLFLKNESLPTTLFNRGNKCMWEGSFVFLASRSACLLLILCKFLLGPS